ncbi:BRO family protein [Xenorhabdus stockiae]|uniref:BRO family protein n=1 Tax=Xenorhabdus stockiae TaxID=351614 RepID=UPI003CE9C1C3
MSSLANKALAFHKTELRVIEWNDQIWLTASDIARALEYRSEDSVSRIYRRNKDEFDSHMTQTVKLTVTRKSNGYENLKMDMRVFSLRGAHLIAMFARTAIAKEFRRWILNLIEETSFKHISPIEKRLTFDCPDCGSPTRVVNIHKHNRIMMSIYAECVRKTCGHIYLVRTEHDHRVDKSHFPMLKRDIKPS